VVEQTLIKPIKKPEQPTIKPVKPEPVEEDEGDLNLGLFD